MASTNLFFPPNCHKKILITLRDCFLTELTSISNMSDMSISLQHEVTGMQNFWFNILIMVLSSHWYGLIHCHDNETPQKGWPGSIMPSPSTVSQKGKNSTWILPQSGPSLWHHFGVSSQWRVKVYHEWRGVQCVVPSVHQLYCRLTSGRSLSHTRVEYHCTCNKVHFNDIWSTYFKELHNMEYIFQGTT